MIPTTVLAEGALDIDEFVIPRVFIAIAVIIVVARLMGALFRRFRQPAVVGEIVGGILLGPTLLGQFGTADETLFPLEIRPFLKVVANLGLIIFMFIVGLELDMKLIRGKERQAGVISLSSIVLPFGLGILLATYLYDRYGEVLQEDGELSSPAFLAFSLFIGASMSVTAFPVLARILTDRGMYRTQIGALTLACAAVDDILAWTLLAIVLAVVDTGEISGDFVVVMVESIAFVGVMFGVVRPLLARLVAVYKRTGKLTPNIMAVILVGFLVSSFLTAEIGIHHIFGAFVFGAIMPREDTHDLFHEILERLENVSVLLLLPVFFVATGLNVEFKDFKGSDVTALGLVLLTACAGKFIGATAGARVQRIPWRKSAAIGTLMNTRGLTELIILNVGREKGILNDRLFTILVVMAVFTTIITEPVLRLFYPDRMLRKDVADAERAALGLVDAYRVIVCVNDIDRAAPLVDVACDLVGGEKPAEIVLSRFAYQASGGELGSGLGNQLAEVAATMEAMSQLQGRAVDRGVACQVINRFSADPVRDWIDQLESLDADVVVLDQGDGPPTVVDRMLAEASCDVVVSIGDADASAESLRGESGPVVLHPGDGPNGNAAVEVAARLAATREIAVDVAGSDDRARRRDQAVTQLNRAGVTAAAVASPSAEAVSGAATVVLAHDPKIAPSSVGRRALLVRAADGLERRNLSTILSTRTGGA